MGFTVIVPAYNRGLRSSGGTYLVHRPRSHRVASVAVLPFLQPFRHYHGAPTLNNRLTRAENDCFSSKRGVIGLALGLTELGAGVTVNRTKAAARVPIIPSILTIPIPSR